MFCYVCFLDVFRVTLMICMVPMSVCVITEHGYLRLVKVITQPHLPRDPNVLDATQQFLTKFAELKALADAAPDPVPTPSRVRLSYCFRLSCKYTLVIVIIIFFF